MSELAVGQMWYRKGSNETVTIREFFKHNGVRGVGYVTGSNESMVYGKTEKAFLKEFRPTPITDAAALAAELKEKLEAVHGKVKVDEG